MRVLSLMPIRRRLAALFVLYFCFPLITVAQQSRPENVMVDGKLSEWANPLPNYDMVTKLYYDIHNDQDFLYLALKRPEWAEKVKTRGRILVAVVGGQPDSSVLKIIYPATNTRDVIDMWNYLEVTKADSPRADTVTIYNDYGIEAGGGFWTYEIKEEKKNDAFSALGEAGQPTSMGLGAACELAIPRKLLPATSGSYTIRIILPGESASPEAKAILKSWSGVKELAPMRDIYISTALTIHYKLK